MNISRRTVLLGAVLAVGLPGRSVAAGTPIRIYKDPSCGCCERWAGALEAAGFSVSIVKETAMDAVKDRLGVPVGLRSCHTAEFGSHVLEGHVPVAAIRRLVAERPPFRGLAVPGMPVGSPGMEVEGAEAEEYEVVGFGGGASRPYMRFRGSTEV